MNIKPAICSTGAIVVIDLGKFKSTASVFLLTQHGPLSVASYRQTIVWSGSLHKPGWQNGSPRYTGTLAGPAAEHETAPLSRNLACDT